MTPKEKADELVDKMNVIHRPKGNGLPTYMHKSQVKRCALIAVREILNLASFYNDTQGEVTYWQEVKEEIENL